MHPHNGVFKNGVVALILALLPVLASTAHAASIDINVATAYAKEYFQTKNLQQFADDVSASTSGQVQFKIHPDGTLIKPADIFSGVVAGKADAGEVFLSSLAKVSPIFGIDSLPFIVSGYDDAKRMWDGSRPAVDKALRAHGLQLLYAVPWPPQNFYSNRPINMLKDLKGLRMRTYSPATERIAELTGAVPVTIQLADLPQAMADEKFDIMLTSSASGVETRAWAKMPYYYRINAWIPKNVVFVSLKTFDRMDDITKKKVLDAAHAAEVRGWKVSQEKNNNNEKELTDNKMSVSTIDPFIRKSLDRFGETMAREWLKNAGSDALSVLLKYTTDRSMK
ncbi:MAG: TRAP transporter substrate-binding protein [Herminiimonas sp.]|nr:TRAP transporter substrate-binding protein [Herminiimonas sp.]